MGKEEKTGLESWPKKLNLGHLELTFKLSNTKKRATYLTEENYMITIDRNIVESNESIRYDYSISHGF